MRIILHIGRHKTGTSSLQKFLSERQEFLSAQGFLYPKAGRAGIAHHDLAESLSRRLSKADPARSTRISQEIIKDIHSEVRPNHHSIILSSEAFQNADPKAVQAALIEWKVEVVVYLREQYAYLLSAYQQKVHAQKYDKSLSEFAQEFNPDYERFIGAWVSAFGEERVKPRLFERELLRDGNIIPDFLDGAGVAFSSNDYELIKDANPSIGGALLELKRNISNKLDADKMPRRLYQVLARLALTQSAYRVRPSLSGEEINLYRSKYESGNEWVRQKYFPDRKSLFSHDSFEVDFSRPVDISECFREAIQAVAEEVQNLPRKVEAELALQKCINDLIDDLASMNGLTFKESRSRPDDIANQLLVRPNRYYETRPGSR